MINNGTLSYDHDRDGTLTQLAGCEAKFRNVDYDTHISIKYLNEKLTVLTDIEDKHEWKVCFESPKVKLPTGYYFGASATTGDLSDNHDIITFKFYELEPIADVSHTSHAFKLTFFRLQIWHFSNFSSLKLLVIQLKQEATLEARKSIIPSAEIFEAPRERKEDVKPGMSNAKVSFELQSIQLAIQSLITYTLFYHFRFSSYFYSAWFAL